jgi:hypothetical protein
MPNSSSGALRRTFVESVRRRVHNPSFSHKLQDSCTRPASNQTPRRAKVGTFSEATQTGVGPTEQLHMGERHRGERHYKDVVAGPGTEQDCAVKRCRPVRERSRIAQRSGGGWTAAKLEANHRGSGGPAIRRILA